MAKQSKAVTAESKKLADLTTSRYRFVVRFIDYITYGDDGTLFGVPGAFMNVFYAGTQHPRSPLSYVTIDGDDARNSVAWVKAQEWIHLEGISINPSNVSYVSLHKDSLGGRVEVQFSSANRIEIPDNSKTVFLAVYEKALGKVRV